MGNGIAGWLVDSLVVKAIFATSYGKGLLITLLSLVLAGVLGAFLLVMLVGWGVLIFSWM